MLEVKEERGLGTTLDVILYDGTLVHRGRDRGCYAGRCHRDESAIPPETPAHERDPGGGAFERVKSVVAASGIKVYGAEP